MNQHDLYGMAVTDAIAAVEAARASTGSLDNCPHCGTDQHDGPHYWRTIMVEIRGVYDGGLYFTCPDCGGVWHRWPEGHHLRERAQKYVDAGGIEPPATLDAAVPDEREAL